MELGVYMAMTSPFCQSQAPLRPLPKSMAALRACAKVYERLVYASCKTTADELDNGNNGWTGKHTVVLGIGPVLSFEQEIPEANVWDLHAGVWGLGRHDGVE